MNVMQNVNKLERKLKKPSKLSQVAIHTQILNSQLDYRQPLNFHVQEETNQDRVINKRVLKYVSSRIISRLHKQ